MEDSFVKRRNASAVACAAEALPRTVSSTVFQNSALARAATLPNSSARRSARSIDCRAARARPNASMLARDMRRRSPPYPGQTGIVSLHLAREGSRPALVREPIARRSNCPDATRPIQASTSRAGLHRAPFALSFPEERLGSFARLGVLPAREVSQALRVKCDEARGCELRRSLNSPTRAKAIFVSSASKPLRHMSAVP